MQEIKIPSQNRRTILALGAESSGNFSFFQNGIIYYSDDFGDLLEEHNFSAFKHALEVFLKKQAVHPAIILSDLHPLFHTTELAKTLAKKYKAIHIPVQHHLAHIFSAIGDEAIDNPKKLSSYSLKSCLGIACDGTGFGFDEKVWGGEIFEIQKTKDGIQYARIGHLENQILLGGEMAIKEPARLLIAILSKFLDKKEVYPHIRQHYSKNESELLWNQLGQNFNCLETSSTARILDAVSVLLGFSKNERFSKHGPVDLLEKNSTEYYVLKPVIEFDKQEEMWILKTTPLFEYLINNLDKDKKRLAATAQKYIADGLIEIIRNTKYLLQAYPRDEIRNTFFAGGMANNKIIAATLESEGFYANKKIPRGDAGISVGQIFHYLLANPRD